MCLSAWSPWHGRTWLSLSWLFFQYAVFLICTLSVVAIHHLHLHRHHQSYYYYIQVGNHSQPEKAMATPPHTLAWKIPWTEEPGRLQSMGSWRVENNWATSLSLFTFMHWRRKWQPTPVFLPGESQGWGSLVGCRLWGRTASDTTEAT